MKGYSLENTLPKFEKDMIPSYYIQKLLAPKPPGPDGVYQRNPFCFGGGGGRLSEEAWKLLLPIFNFYYMGSAEFECGEVPLALVRIYETVEQFEILEVRVPVTEIRTMEEWYPAKEKKRRKKRKEPPTEVECKIVYVFAPKQWHAECELRIRQLAIEEGRLNHPRSTKSAVHLAESLKDLEYFNKVKGWLELDNGWFFFTDKTMCAKVVELFNRKEENGQSTGADSTSQIPEVVKTDNADARDDQKGTT